MTFDQLRTYCKVVECQSVSGAARVLFLSHPAVSLQLKRLQEEIESPLFVATRPRVAVTECGQRVYDHASRALLEMDAIRRVGLEAGTPLVRLGADQAIGNYVLPALVQRFRTAHPDLPVEMLTKYRPTLFAKLAAGEVDLVATLAVGIPGRFARRVVGRQEMFVVLPPDHALADRGVLLPEDLSRLRFVLPPQGLSGTRSFIDRVLSEHGLSTGSVVEFQHSEGIKQAVAATGEAALLFWASVATEVRNGRLVARRVDGVEMAADVCLVRRRERLAPAAAELARNLERTLAQAMAAPA